MCVYSVYMFNHTFFQLNNAKHHLHNNTTVSHNQHILQSSEIIYDQWVLAESETPALPHYSSSMSTGRLKSRTGLENKDTSFYSDNWHANLVFDIKTKVFSSPVTTNQLKSECLRNLCFYFVDHLCFVSYIQNNLTFYYLVFLRMLMCQFQPFLTQ